MDASRMKLWERCRAASPSVHIVQGAYPRRYLAANLFMQTAASVFFFDVWKVNIFYRYTIIDVSWGILYSN